MSKNHLESLQKEKKIFYFLKGNYVVRAVYTFTHDCYLCFVMEYMRGGDLGAILENQGYLDQYSASFYVAEII